MSICEGSDCVAVIVRFEFAEFSEEIGVVIERPCPTDSDVLAHRLGVDDPELLVSSKSGIQR
jgi:hypothetical protein